MTKCWKAMWYCVGRKIFTPCSDGRGAVKGVKKKEVTGSTSGVEAASSGQT